MKHLNKTIELKLGSHISCNLILEKNRTRLKTFVSLFGLGTTNDVGFTLALKQRSNPTFLNFGSSFTPSFIYDFEEVVLDDNTIVLSLSDVFGDVDYLYTTYSNCYYDYSTNKKVVKIETEGSTIHKFFVDENNTMEISQDGNLISNGYILTKYKDNIRFVLNDNGIFEYKNNEFFAQGKRVVFVKDQTNLITEVHIYNGYYSDSPSAKKERVLFTYFPNGVISTIHVYHIDGTTDSYIFTFEENAVFIQHDESKTSVAFKFDDNNNVVAYKRDLDDPFLEQYYSTINIYDNHSIISYNDKFLYLHYDENDNLDYTFDNNGLLNVCETIKFKESYLISKQSNTFYLNKTENKYENLAPFPVLTQLSKWEFNKTSSNSNILHVVLPNNYFSVFTSSSSTISVDETDEHASLVANIEHDFTNRTFVFLALFNVKNAGSAAFFDIKFTPYYQNVAADTAYIKRVNVGQLNQNLFVLDQIQFEVSVDEIKIEILFNAGQTVELLNLMFFEHFYGQINFYNSDFLNYKTISNGNITRIKRYDYEAKHIELSNYNIFLDEDEVLENGYKQTIKSGNDVTQYITRDFSNNIIKDETVYSRPGTIYKKVSENTLLEQNLIASKKEHNSIETTFTYYENSNMCNSTSSFNNLTKIDYTNDRIVFNFYDSSNENASLYKTESNYNNDGQPNSFKEENKNPINFSYDYFGNLISVNSNNVVLEENSYEAKSEGPGFRLKSKTLNNYTYNLNYDESDLLVGVNNSENETLFSLEYNYLNNVKRMCDIEGMVYTYTYDFDNRVIEEVNNDFSIKNIYFNDNLHFKEYSFGETEKDIFLSQKAESLKSEITNNIYSYLCDSNRYVALFERTNTYTKTNNNLVDYCTRYASMIKQYYSLNEYIPLEFVNSYDNHIISLDVEPKIFLKVYDSDPIFYKKTITRSSYSMTSSIGAVFKNLSGKERVVLCSELLYLYKIRLVCTKGASQLINRLKIRVCSMTNEILQEFDTGIDFKNTDIFYCHLNYEIHPSYLKIHLFSETGCKYYIFNKTNNIPSTSQIKHIFNESNANENIKYEYLCLYSVFGDFEQNIPLKEIVEYYSLLIRALKIEEHLEEDDFFLNENRYSSIYENINSLYKWIPLKKNFIDSEGKLPKNYINDVKHFVFDKAMQTDAFYCYKKPVIYDANFGSQAIIGFKAHIYSIEEKSQTYFSLFNDKVNIKLLTDTNGLMYLSLNGSNKLVFNNFNLLLNPHTILLNYRVSGSTFVYQLIINNSATSGTIPLNSLVIGDFSNLSLIIGADSTQETLLDINQQHLLIYKDSFNGTICDVFYSNNNVSGDFINKIEKNLNNISALSSFDVFGRINNSAVRYNFIDILKKRYEYNVESNDSFTPFLKSEKIYFKNSDSSSDTDMNRKYSYFYDSLNNPTLKYQNLTCLEEHINFSGGLSDICYVSEYEYYPGTNYIKKEIITKYNDYTGIEDTFVKSWEREYFYSGSNVSKIEYKENDVLIKTDNFTYETNKNQITYHNSQRFVYDGYFLTQITDITGQVKKQFGYRGTKLSSYNDIENGRSLSFVYDTFGRRTLKIDNNTNTEIKYIYDNNSLIKEIHDDFELKFIYDSLNSMIGFIYKNYTTNEQKKFFYLRNALNDVVEILNENGNSVAHYLYDAYGNLIEVSDSSQVNVAVINPIRYRGYYYDEETHLFYCDSRYYSCELRCFLRVSDISELNSCSINGLNFYAYANNNPICFSYNNSDAYNNTGIGIDSKFNGNVNFGITSNGDLNLGWLASGLYIGSTIHSLYTSISGLVNHTFYFAKNFAPFADDMKMLGVSMKDGVLAFNQFSWGFGKVDIFAILLGVGLDIYDSIQRGVSPGGVVLGAALTAAKGAGLIYLNKGIIYGATTIGGCFGPIGAIVGFILGGIICIVVDIFLSNWLDDLIDKIAI